jgi:hypothetical protein
LETFTKAREFVENSGYANARKEALAALDLISIDEPIVDIVVGFAALPHCFTLQCCYGHFLWTPLQGPHNLEPIPASYSGSVRYRIAYIALCLENSRQGRTLRHSLARLPAADPDYVQFGSADWFWERWVNSYALQVAPAASVSKDEAILESSEAHRILRARNLFFRELKVLLDAEMSEQVAGQQ